MSNYLIYGGHIKDIPKPFKFRFPNPNDKREIDIAITVWRRDGYGSGNGHYHIDLKEQNNAIWNSKEETWQEPFRVDYGQPYYNEWKQFEGRSQLECELNSPDEACKWINRILSMWKVNDQENILDWHFYGTEDDAEDNYFKEHVKLPTS